MDERKREAKRGERKSATAATLCGNNGAMKKTSEWSERRRKRVVKRVAWADEVGGLLETIKCNTYEGEVTLAGSGKGSKGEQREGVITEAPRGKVREVANGVNAEASRAKTRELAYESRWVGYNKSEDGSFKPQLPSSGTYKEVLLRKPPHHLLHHKAFLGLRSATHSHRRPANRNTSGRCFRCLASDHKAAQCRDLVRCLRCRKFGHRASATTTR